MPAPIHIISIFTPMGGGPLQALELYETLSRHRPVTLWAACREPTAAVRDQYPFRMLDARRLRFPRTGTFIFVGVYFPVGRWLAFSTPRRVVVVYNSDSPDWLQRMLPRLALARRPVEFVYVSEALQAQVNRPGIVERCPIGLSRFQPRSGSAEGPFTVGRLSRDDPAKHHPDDVSLYRRLAEAGMAVRLMGATVLRPDLGGVPGITLLAENAEPVETFLQGLDCFLYRTGPQIVEPFGRVIAEAMATGLPVVCGREGHYTEWVHHEQNGFLFDDPDQAYDQVCRLRADPSMCLHIGQAARHDVERMYSDEARQAALNFYLR